MMIFNRNTTQTGNAGTAGTARPATAPGANARIARQLAAPGAIARTARQPAAPGATRRIARQLAAPGATARTPRRALVLAVAAIVLAAAAPASAQSVGLRPGIAAYTGTVGFEAMVEGRFALPLLDEATGTLTASALLGYSGVSVDESRKDGFILAAGAAWEIPIGPPGLYLAPGLAAGVEFSFFTEAEIDSAVAPMLSPLAEAGYRFDSGLAAGIQIGPKLLFYTGERAATEVSLVFGPFVSYAFGSP